MNDEELIQVVAAQGPEAEAAFEQLAARHYAFLVNYALKRARRARGSGFKPDQATMDRAHEHAIDTLMRARKKAHYFHPSRGSFRQWICTLAGRACARKNAAPPKGARRYVVEAPAETTPQALEWVGRVRAAICSLPDPIRGAMLMRYCDDLTERDIARRMHVSRSTAHEWLAAGCEALGRLIETPEADVKGVTLDRRAQRRAPGD